MTKVTILGQEPVEVSPKKAIKFEGFLDAEHKIKLSTNLLHPSDWGEIVLLSRNYKEGKYDLMFAKTRRHDSEDSCLYLGYFNDGVV